MTVELVTVMSTRPRCTHLVEIVRRTEGIPAVINNRKGTAGRILWKPRLVWSKQETSNMSIAGMARNQVASRFECFRKRLPIDRPKRRRIDAGVFSPNAARW